MTKLKEITEETKNEIINKEEKIEKLEPIKEKTEVQTKTEKRETTTTEKHAAQKSKTPILKKILITILVMIILGIMSVMILFYGPIPTFREWWITTAMTTMSHQYLAEWFFDEETINAVLSKNTIKETEEETDTTLITVVPKPEEEEKEEEQFANEYEKQILGKKLDKEKYNIYAEGENYRIIEISGKGYSGYMAVIYDPSKIKVATTKYIGRSGQYLTEMSKDNDAIIAINGGGFLDEDSHGNGSSPLGLTIKDGKVVSNRGYTTWGGMIGFDKDNKLVLGKYSSTKAQQLGIRDAVTFGPYLIVNGEPSKISGNGGWGTAPRTAIGQRQDGIVLFLVLDGRRVTKPGATIKDLIEIMVNYGAYNATNLDGGTSSAMTLNHEIINDPMDASGNHRTRHISTAFILTK